MSDRKLSGLQFRKRRAQNLEEKSKQAKIFKKFFRTLPLISTELIASPVSKIKKVVTNTSPQ